jgi:hypothetical protein
VRDWTDLRIAVSAGAWLAAARPGDMIELITDDQAFDAVGDVATALGVRYQRLSFRALSGLGLLPEPEPAAAPRGDGASRRGRRGWRGRRGGSPGPSRPAPASAPSAAPRPAAIAPAAVAAAGEAHTAPADEIRAVVEDLLATSPGGVTLDALSNALKSRGFRRTPGSPRLITRLRHLKGFEVTRNGVVRLMSGARPGSAAPPPAPVGEPTGDMVHHVAQLAGTPADALAAPSDGAGEPEDGDEPQPDVSPTGQPLGQTEPRRRRRRGGRRRRGRRGGGGGGPSAPPGEPVPASEGAE